MSDSQPPELSDACVIIPTLFRRHALKQALESLLQQDTQPTEILLIDDRAAAASTAPPQDLPRNDRMRIIRRHDHHSDRSGAPLCRNLGLRSTNSEFVIFLDDDDMLLPNCIGSRVSIMRKNPGHAFCVRQGIVFETSPHENNSLWCPWDSDADDLTEFLRDRVLWQTSGVLWRRTALIDLGAWNESLTCGQDYELHVRALAHGATYSKSTIPDYAWRKARDDSMSSFDNFKRTLASGARSLSYSLSWQAVNEANAWTPSRKKAVRKTATLNAIKTRLFGGSRNTAQSCITDAYRSGGIGRLRFIELSLALSAWVSVFGANPSMWYLRFRGYSAK